MLNREQEAIPVMMNAQIIEELQRTYQEKDAAIRARMAEFANLGAQADDAVTPAAPTPAAPRDSTGSAAAVRRTLFLEWCLRMMT